MRKIVLLLFFTITIYSQDYTIQAGDSINAYYCNNVKPDCEVIKIYRITFKSTAGDSSTAYLLIRIDDRTATVNLYNTVDVEFTSRLEILNKADGSATVNYTPILKDKRNTDRGVVGVTVSGQIQLDIFRSSLPASVPKKYTIKFTSGSPGSVLRIVCDNIFVENMTRGTTYRAVFNRMLLFVNEGNETIQAKYFLEKP